MTTKAAATQRFPLDHLMECGQCGAPMQLEDRPAPVYTCPGSPDQAEPCGTPSLRAADLNRHLLGQVMIMLITDSTFDTFREEVGEALAEAGQEPPEAAELRRAAVEPEWLLAEPEAGVVLSRFIDRIRVEQIHRPYPGSNLEQPWWSTDCRCPREPRWPEPSGRISVSRNRCWPDPHRDQEQSGYSSGATSDSAWAWR